MDFSLNSFYFHHPYYGVYDGGLTRALIFHIAFLYYTCSHSNTVKVNRYHVRVGSVFPISLDFYRWKHLFTLQYHRVTRIPSQMFTTFLLVRWCCCSSGSDIACFFLNTEDKRHTHTQIQLTDYKTRNVRSLVAAVRWRFSLLQHIFPSS